MKHFLQKVLLITIVNVVCCYCTVYAEDEKLNIIKNNFEPTYFTICGGVDTENKTKCDQQYYEAQFYLHYNLKDVDEIGCLKNSHLKTFIPIRLQVRQDKTSSSPVKTPSYNPGVRAYYWHNSWVNDDAKKFYYTSLGFHHYSNGQSGPHLNNDGTVNTGNGSFSSDYLELSGYMKRDDVWGKLNVRSYLTGLTWEPDQTDRYETFLFEATGKKVFPCLGNSTAQGTVGYKYGRKYDAPGELASFSDNLQYTGELIIPLKSTKIDLFNWKDIDLYVRWDMGHDYYNINYQNRMNKFQLGVIAKNF